MELTKLGRSLFRIGSELYVNKDLGVWYVAITDPRRSYTLTIAERAAEVKALLDMGIIKFKNVE